MKHLFLLSIFFLSFTAAANTATLTEKQCDEITELALGNDRGKRARRTKRKNKRRKRKCRQFGRRAYAG